MSIQDIANFSKKSKRSGGGRLQPMEVRPYPDGSGEDEDDNNDNEDDASSASQSDGENALGHMSNVIGHRCQISYVTDVKCHIPLF